MDAQESLRIHTDWWEQCRTCVSWQGDRSTDMESTCANPESDLHQKVTMRCGHCSHWVSFDPTTADQIRKTR